MAGILYSPTLCLVVVLIELPQSLIELPQQLSNPVGERLA
jgi:hypothetical protein